MAYVVARPAGSYEIRESRNTPRGPRARTLATFRTLSDDVIERARSRSDVTLDAKQLRRAALRAGAPVEASSAADAAAGTLLAELTAGKRPRPALEKLLREALTAGDGASDAARAAGRWVAATPEARGETLRDLLLLSDHLPPRQRSDARFPRLHSKS
jgi:hypothetical protein